MKRSVYPSAAFRLLLFSLAVLLPFFAVAAPAADASAEAVGTRRVCFEPHPDEADASSGATASSGAFACNAVPVSAAGRESWGALSFHYGIGIGKEYQRATLNYETPVLWSLDVGFLGRVDLTVEAGASSWYTVNSSFDHDRLWQVGATPLLRWWAFDPFYIEGGVGISFFNTTYFVDRQISTSFQFADQVGVGVRLWDSVRLSVRYAHFSNGGIKQPNPGLNVCVFAIACDF